jgi:hypothetical protein
MNSADAVIAGLAAVALRIDMDTEYLKPGANPLSEQG